MLDFSIQLISQNDNKAKVSINNGGREVTISVTVRPGAVLSENTLYAFIANEAAWIREYNKDEFINNGGSISWYYSALRNFKALQYVFTPNQLDEFIDMADDI